MLSRFDEKHYKTFVCMGVFQFHGQFQSVTFNNEKRNFEKVVFSNRNNYKRPVILTSNRAKNQRTAQKSTKKLRSTPAE